MKEYISVEDLERVLNPYDYKGINYARLKHQLPGQKLPSIEDIEEVRIKRKPNGVIKVPRVDTDVTSFIEGHNSALDKVIKLYGGRSE